MGKLAQPGVGSHTPRTFSARSYFAYSSPGRLCTSIGQCDSADVICEMDVSGKVHFPDYVSDYVSDYVTDKARVDVAGDSRANK